MKVLLIEDEKPASTRLQKLLHEVAADIEVLDVLDSIQQSSIVWLKIIQCLHSFLWIYNWLMVRVLQYSKK